MNSSAMEPADDKRSHASREDFGHLSDLEWSAIERMAGTVGEPAVGAMLLSLNGNEQHATIAKFIQHELDEAKKKNALLAPLANPGSIGHRLFLGCGHMDLTLQLTLMVDLLNVTTRHSHLIYLYFAKLNRLQFELFSSLSKLFLGKKINVLRHRMDTCEYDIEQLLLGTLLFTVLVFLVTTNLVFFVFFMGVRGSILLISLLLWLPVVTLRSFPLASVLNRVWNPHLFIVGMQLQASQDLAVDCIVIENVSVGHHPPELDTQHRLKLRQALKMWKTSERCDSQSTVFELMPVASSFVAQFTRFRAYVHDASAHYSLAAIMKACLFGSAGIAQVPLSILFGLPEMQPCE